MAAVDTEVLKQWRQSLDRQLDELRGRIKPLQEEFERTQAQLALVDQLMLTADGGAAAAPAVAAPRRSTRDAPSFLDVAGEILADEGVPLHYEQLYQRIVSRDIRVSGANPAANLLTHMSRDSRFVRVGRGTYGIAGRDTPRSRRKRRKASAKRR